MTNAEKWKRIEEVSAKMEMMLAERQKLNREHTDLLMTETTDHARRNIRRQSAARKRKK